MTTEATPGEPIAEPKPEPSPTEKLYRNMALAIARQVEAEIKLALNEVMGTEDWKFEDLVPRCTKVTVEDHETFIFDGVPLICFGPPEFVREDVEGKPCLRVVRSIERLWEALEEVEPGNTGQQLH